MSAGVSDQRMKGQGNQVSNGPKEQLGAEGGTGSEEFEPWRSQQQQNSAAHTAYGTSVPISSGTDLYNMNTAGYYGSGGTYPYQAYGVGDGTWSNGTDPMTFLSGGYPHDSYSMDAMFNPSTTFSTPTAFGQHSSFNYFHSNGDYSTWGNQLGQRKYDDYYRDPQNMYTTQAMPDSLKSVEQAMQNLAVDSKEVLGGSGGINTSGMGVGGVNNPGGVTSSGGGRDGSSSAKKTTWASIASQPAKPQLSLPNQGLKKKGPGMPPGPIIPGKHNIDIGTWGSSKTPPGPPPQQQQLPGPPLQQQLAQQQQLPPGHVQQQQQSVVAAAAAAGNNAVMAKSMTSQPPPSMQPGVRQGGWAGGPPTNRAPPTQQQRPGGPPQLTMQSYQPQGMMPTHLPPPASHAHVQGLMQGGPMSVMVAPIPAVMHPVLDELRGLPLGKNNYNPAEFDLTAPHARFFVIKSYSEDDIHRSIKYEIWCSTEHGNKRLDQAYRERDQQQSGGSGGGTVYLFFSVNGSGHFCGMAQMVSAVDYNSNSSVWSQDKWKGQFKVRWVYVKDVPNVQLRHIRLENNENKPVTNSRDAQEVPHAKGLQVLRIMHSYRHSTSIFDDFVHYEKRQEEEDSRKQPDTPTTSSSNNNGGGGGKDTSHHSHHQQQQQPPQHGHNRGDHRGGGGGGAGEHRGGDHQSHRGGGGGGGRDRDRDRNHDKNHDRNHDRVRHSDGRDHHHSHHVDGGGGGGHHGGGGGGGGHRGSHMDHHGGERAGDRGNGGGDRGGGAGGDRGGGRDHHHKDNNRGRSGRGSNRN